MSFVEIFDPGARFWREYKENQADKIVEAPAPGPGPVTVDLDKGVVYIQAPSASEAGSAAEAGSASEAGQDVDEGGEENRTEDVRQ